MENGVVSAQQVKVFKEMDISQMEQLLGHLMEVLRAREIQLTFLSSLETPILLIWLKQA